MARKDALRLRKVKVIATGAHEYVKLDPVPEGFLYCLEQIAWEIDVVTSGGNTRCRLYIEGHGYNHYLEEQDGPSANALYTFFEKPYLYPRERLVLEIDHADSNTTAQLFATGYWEEIKKNA